MEVDLITEALETEASTDQKIETTESTSDNKETKSEGTILDDALNGEVENKDNQAKQTDSKEAEIATEYSDFKMPEGMKLDDGLAKDFKEKAKELKLNQDQAQALVDLQAKHVQGITERIQSDFQNQVKAWRDETVQELGPSLVEDKRYIAKAVKQFGSAEFSSLLTQTGLGNNKEVVKFLISVGKKTSDDILIDGKKPGTEQLSAAKKLYPSMK